MDNHCPLRFIPARAGNAYCLPGHCPSLAVHPRASGERYQSMISNAAVAGSSPRERGTHLSRADRFIPARAGNARAFHAYARARTVHPRASGERAAASTRSTYLAGSSPRERGTQASACLRASFRRFIPARAGNATVAVCRCWRGSVHPRASGERSFWKSLIWQAFYDVKQRTGKLGIFRLPARDFSHYRSRWRELHQLEAVEIRRHAAVDAAGIEVIAGFVR